MSPISEMVHVALAHEHTWPHTQRGGERYLHDIAWYLRHNTKMHPRIITTRGRPRHDSIEDVPVQRTWSLAFPPLGRVSRRWPGLAAAVASRSGHHALSAGPISVVHGFSPNAALAGTRTGRPTVFTAVGVPDGDFARKFPRRWDVVKSAALEADVVTAVGNDAARRFADVLGRSVVALQPGIRMDAFPARLEPRTGPPLILFASTVTPRYKGFRAVLEALPAVVSVHSDARLAVLGPGDVDALVADASPAVRRLRDRVETHLPKPAEMPGHYRQGTVTVLASSGEAFGLVLAESLACGTPIVASTDGGPAEILGERDGVVGHATAPHDPDGIAEALCAAIDLASESGTPERCRKHAEQWGWLESIGPRHEKIYTSLLDA